MPLTIVRANCPHGAAGGSSDLYCVVGVEGLKEEWHKTTGAGPEWNDTCDLPGEAAGCVLTFELRISSSSSASLGKASLKLGAATTADETFDFEVPLAGAAPNTSLELTLSGVRPPTLLLLRSQRERRRRDRPDKSETTEADALAWDASHEETWPVPEDKLAHSDPQSWAVFFLVLAVCLAVYSGGSPISCVKPPDQQPDFSKCLGIRSDEHKGNVVGLTLPKFCWSGCMRVDDALLLLLLGFALFGQSFVVILNAGGFSDWLRASFYFDLWDFMPQEGSMDDDEHAADIAHSFNKHGRFALKERALRVLRKPMEQKLKKSVLHKMQKAVASSSSKWGKQLSSARAMNTAVMVVVICAWIQVSGIIFFGYSQNSVFFRCQEKGDSDLLASKMHTLHSYLVRGTIFPLVAMWCFLLLTTVCVFKARWAVHLVVRPVDCKSASRTTTAAQRLREHFDAVPVTKAEDPFAEAPCELGFFPRMGNGYPEEDFLPLTTVAGQRLVGVRYNGIYVEGDDVRWIMGAEGAEAMPDIWEEMAPRQQAKVPRREAEEVTLLFSSKKKHRRVLSCCTDGNPHRVISIFLHLAAGLSLGVAANSCWACVQGINVEADANLSTPVLERRLLLLGACGRSGGRGNSTMLASIALLCSAMQQLMLRYLYDKKHAESPNPQLTATVLDFRRHAGLDVDSYEKACFEWEESASEASTSEMAAVCYVWEDEEGKVADATPRLLVPGRDIKSERATWSRSKKPRNVKLLRLSDAKRKQMAAGLVTEHGPPSICIEVLSEDAKLKTAPTMPLVEDTGSPANDPKSGRSSPPVRSPKRLHSKDIGCQQIIPVEFIAGFFHAEVNLGPRQAWENMSQSLALVSLFLALADIGFHWAGAHSGALSTCRDVKNEATCIHWERQQDRKAEFHILHKGQPVDFRSSIGPWMSLVSTCAAAVGLLALRVAGETNVEHPQSWGDVCRLYCEALRGGLLLICLLLQWALRSFHAGCRNALPCLRRRAILSGGGSKKSDDEYEPLVDGGPGA